MREWLCGKFLRAMYRYQDCKNRWMDWILAGGCSRLVGGVGKSVHFHYPFQITGGKKAFFGSNVHISRDSFIRAEGGLSVGDNVHIGRHLRLYTVNHNFAGNALPYDDGLISKPVSIGDNVWIGINVTIVPGTQIGEGAIIGAGTVVSGIVEPLSICGGQPFRVLRKRDEEHYFRLKQQGKFGGCNGRHVEPGTSSNFPQ